MKAFFYNLKELDSLAQLIYTKYLKKKSSPPLFILIGDMGSGKTTFVKNIVEENLNSKNIVTSPTYSYINTYRSKSRLQINHFDLFRLKNIEQFEHMGFNEYLDFNNDITFIEWGELILPLIKNKPHLILKFEQTGELERKLSITENR